MPPFTVLFCFSDGVFQFLHIAVFCLPSGNIVKEGAKPVADVLPAAFSVQEDLYSAVLQFQACVFQTDVFKGVLMKPKPEDVCQADEDDIAVVQFFIGLSCINQLQINHSLVVPASFR